MKHTLLINSKQEGMYTHVCQLLNSLVLQLAS